MARRAMQRRQLPAPDGRLILRPPPVGGMNTRDALTDMAKDDAVSLINMYPDKSEVVSRKGHESHATGAGAAAVETLVEYYHDADRHLLAAGAGEIWDVTAAGAASSLANGFTVNRWATARQAAYQLWVNGTDTPQTYDGTTVTDWLATGPTLVNVIGCHLHRNRLFVWEKDSGSFWYGGIDAIAGAFVEFPLSSVAQLGGTIVAMKSWATDGGTGPRDLAVFFMSTGEILIYDGSDPGDAADWSIVQRYFGGVPVSRDGFCNIGADIWYIARHDYESLTKIVVRSRDARDPSKIRESKMMNAIAAAAESYGTAPGWQLINCLGSNFMLANVPTTGGFEQHIMNTRTQNWAIYRYPAYVPQCWAEFANGLYFGGTAGEVWKAESGYEDDGEPIECDATIAWNLLDTPLKKIIAAHRLSLVLAGESGYSAALGFDFQPSISCPDPQTVTISGTPWGSPWGSPWSVEMVTRNEWRAGGGAGFHVALRARFRGNRQIKWNRTDYIVRKGAAI